jgi:AhpD family alkylhydroperoxidase
MSQRLNYTELSAPQYKALLALDRALSHSSLEPRLRHLAKIRASQLNGCLFCMDMHTKEAIKDGESMMRLVHLPAWRESPLFDPKERAALEWTEEVTRLDGKGIPDAALERAHRGLSDQELSDLTFVVAVINTWNRFGVAFTPEPGSLDKVLGLEGQVA